MKLKSCFRLSIEIARHSPCKHCPPVVHYSYALHRLCEAVSNAEVCGAECADQLDGYGADDGGLGTDILII
jgi:hypothetical protein